MSNLTQKQQDKLMDELMVEIKAENPQIDFPTNEDIIQLAKEQEELL